MVTDQGDSHVVKGALKGPTVCIHTNMCVIWLLLSICFSLSNVSLALYGPYCIDAR